MRKFLFLTMVLLGNVLPAQELVPFRVGEFRGYSDVQGKLVIHPEYDRAGWFEDGLAPVAIGCQDCWDVYDGKWGYINPAGKLVIPMQFDEAREFSEGLAPARQGDTWGFIRTSGAWAIQPRFLEVLPFQHGVAWIQDTLYQWGMISASGKVILEPQYAGIGIPKEGLTPVYNRFEWGYVNDSGERVIDLQYTFVTPFSNGKAIVQQGKKYFQINTAGTILQESSETEFLWYLEPYALKRSVCPNSGDNPYGKIALSLIHSNGKEILPCGKFDEINIKNDHWAFVTNWKDGTWINDQGMQYGQNPEVEMLDSLLDLNLPEVPKNKNKNDKNLCNITLQTPELNYNEAVNPYLAYVSFEGDSVSIKLKIPVVYSKQEEQGVTVNEDQSVTFTGSVTYAELQQLNKLKQSGQGKFMYLYRTPLPSPALLRHPYFLLIKNGTDLLDAFGQSLYYFRNGIADLLREPQFSEFRNSMLDLIHQRGKELTTVGNTTSKLPVYTGRTMAEVMSSATIKDLDAFVAYLNAHPARWAGTSEKLTVAFESWLSGK